MSILDVFNTNPFGVVSLTEALNLLPFAPSRIGQMGLFKRKGQTQPTLLLEELAGIISLLPFAPRGAPGAYGKKAKRTMRTLSIPHIPHNDTLLATDVEGVRAFGSESTLETVSGLVNDRLAQMRQNHEVTLEHQRAGAIQGIVRDADATVLYNLFEEFGVGARSTVDFVFGTSTTSQRLKTLAVKRLVEDGLGAGTYDHIHALCGKTFFETFINHADVELAYARYQNGSMLRNDPRAGFEFAGIVYEEYRGKALLDGGTTTTEFLPAAEAQFFPVGVTGLFQTFDAPADFIETVNTVGRPVYAKQERMEFDRGIKLHTQSNPLCICTRPNCLVKGFSST